MVILNFVLEAPIATDNTGYPCSIQLLRRFWHHTQNSVCCHSWCV